MERFNLGRGMLLMNALGWLVAGLILVIAIASWSSREAQGQDRGSPPVRLRKFYLSTNTAVGNAALLACAPGYHMASIYEILDTSNLEYDTSLGVSSDDAGSGPPSATPGWIRTGRSSSGTGGPGGANCEAWTSSASGHLGSVVDLDPTWGSTLLNPYSPWRPVVVSCNLSRGVWCVHD